MTLGELIEMLEAVDDKSVVLRRGFHNPHSYRGSYSRLAFEPAENVTVHSMLVCAKEALGNTYVGYKGGDFVMEEYTDVYLANWSECGEELGAMLLSYMLKDVVDHVTTLRPDGPQTKAALWREVADRIDQEGFHYAFTRYFSPEYMNCDQLDPELAKMWREYIALSEKIAKHVGAEV